MARIKVTPTPDASTYFIDATNICHWGREMSLQVLLQLLLEIKRKKQTFFCIFDANTSYYIPDNEKKIYKKLLEHTDFFYQVSGGKRADDFILELADRQGSAVISNDNYSDPKYSKYKWKDREAEPMRLFMGEVIPVPSGDHLILFDLEINIVLKEPTDKLYRKLQRILFPPRAKFEGNVKFVNNHKGWGRIVYQIEDEVNFRTSELPQTVEQGQRVAFSIEETDKGEYARNIAVLQVDEKRVKGRVVQFDENRGMGAIKPEQGGDDLFFYKSYFEDPDNLPKINKNQRVSFVLGTNSKGECAKKVKFEEEDPRDVKIKLLKERNKYLEDKLRSREDEIKRLKQNNQTQGERSRDTSKQHPAPKNKKPEQRNNNNNNNQTKKANTDKKREVEKNNTPPRKKQPQEEKQNKPNGKKENNQRKDRQNNKTETPKKQIEKPIESKQVREKSKNNPSNKTDKDSPKTEEKVKTTKKWIPKAELKKQQPTEDSKKSASKLEEKNTKPLQKEGEPKKQTPKTEEKPKQQKAKKPKKQTPKAEEQSKQQVVKEPNKQTPKAEEKPKQQGAKKSKEQTPKAEEQSKQQVVKEPKKQTPKVEEKPRQQGAKEPKKQTPKADEKPRQQGAKEPEKQTPKAEEKPKQQVAKEPEKQTPKAEEKPKQQTAKKTTESPIPTKENKQKSSNSKSSAKPASSVKKPVKKRAQVSNSANNEEEKQYSKWWKSLEKQWQMAFNVVVGNGEIIARPANEKIKGLFKIKRLTFYRTTKNKLSFKLTNLTGVRNLTMLQTLNVAEHEISNLRGTDKLVNLQSLNCNKNQLKNLRGIEALKSLKQFSCVGNELPANSFTNLPQQLPKLEKLDARSNKLSTEQRKNLKESLKNIAAKF